MRGGTERDAGFISKMKHIKNIENVDTLFTHRSEGQRLSGVCVSVGVIIRTEVQSLLWCSEGPTVFSCANSKLMGFFGKICSHLSVRRKIIDNFQ